MKKEMNIVKLNNEKFCDFELNKIQNWLQDYNAERQGKLVSSYKRVDENIMDSSQKN